jgi:hypothetical protein
VDKAPKMVLKRLLLNNLSGLEVILKERHQD